MAAFDWETCVCDLRLSQNHLRRNVLIITPQLECYLCIYVCIVYLCFTSCVFISFCFLFSRISLAYFVSLLSVLLKKADFKGVKIAKYTVCFTLHLHLLSIILNLLAVK